MFFFFNEKNPVHCIDVESRKCTKEGHMPSNNIYLILYTIYTQTKARAKSPTITKNNMIDLEKEVNSEPYHKISSFDFNERTVWT